MPELELTVLIATYRRPESLRRTLAGILACERPPSTELAVVVVDNAGCDETRDVCERAGPSVTRIVELGAGKNRALNRGLAEAALGDVVVFTDDDVDPAPEWLVAIRGACEAFPEHDVFGGRIDVVWPTDRVPDWARDPMVRELGFSEHAPLEAAGQYPEGRVPFGPNFWLRRSVIEAGHRFDESVGPHPRNRILGDETHFLRRIVAAGHRAAYESGAAVGHRITRAMLEPRVVRRRAFDLGRGIPYEHGLPRAELLEASPLRWRLLRRLLVVRDAVRAGLARLGPGLARELEPQRSLGFNVESLRMTRSRRAP